MVEHLAQGLAHLATSDPHSIKNTSHGLVTFWLTGEEVAALFTKINGKPAIIKDFTKKDRELLRADSANFGPPKAGYLDKWENNTYTYPPNTVQYDGADVEEVARRFA